VTDVDVIDVNPADADEKRRLLFSKKVLIRRVVRETPGQWSAQDEKRTTRKGDSFSRKKC
jgi:hypothetical protein